MNRFSRLCARYSSEITVKAAPYALHKLLTSITETELAPGKGAAIGGQGAREQ